ncbi:uncharacterized protein LOC102718850 [Oryza brachyantha]|uniref:uncharacterized protein LOC102718850 n=1 Tax=Oryza brachyantha TaxID=4533 RepID=UPI001ADCB811|nr:uncharacterized protein LOC102718850 [Oryza brachyantha]
MERLVLPAGAPLPLLPHRPSQPLLRRPAMSCAASSGSSSDPSPTAADAPTATDAQTSSGSKPTGVKNRLRARNQSRRVREVSPPAQLEINVKAKSASSAATTRREKQGRKEWEEMSLAEKAGELYVGEKGLLFWLNKFAYASIFIMVGAWILFRFVGPSIGLYQLDAPPLAPTDVFGGSP